MISKKKNEDAVSPVIGVMLMLVVTVVIAAVVVTFSTGLAGSTGTTPTALFEVSGTEICAGSGDEEELSYLNIRHKGGEIIPLSELQITLESVGGKNNGITIILTASDEMNHFEQYEVYTSPDQGAINLYEGYKDTYRNEDRESKKQSVLRKMKALEEQWGVVFSDENDPLSGTLVGGIRTDREATYPLSVFGQETPTKSTVSTGDIIHIVPLDVNGSDNVIYAGTAVKWTISYIPTNSIIAKGEFEVIAD